MYHTHAHTRTENRRRSVQEGEVRGKPWQGLRKREAGHGQQGRSFIVCVKRQRGTDMLSGIRFCMEQAVFQMLSCEAVVQTLSFETKSIALTWCLIHRPCIQFRFVSLLGNENKKANFDLPNAWHAILSSQIMRS